MTNETTNEEHTAGPWVILGAVDEDNRYLVESIANENDEYVCFLARSGIMDNEQQITANGHLIASAPTLLKELEALIKACEDNVEVPQSAYDAVRNGRGL